MAKQKKYVFTVYKSDTRGGWVVSGENETGEYYRVISPTFSSKALAKKWRMAFLSAIKQGDYKVKG